MLCYVGHHDAAYAWAERRKIERHPQTGAAQLVEVRETVREIVVPRYIEGAPQVPAAKTLFSDTPDWVFLSYGVPLEWLADVRAATEDTLFDVAEHLPQEAGEALLELATTGVPPPLTHPDLPPHADAFEHPDSYRRFRVIENVEELERALDAPWEKWTVFFTRRNGGWLNGSSTARCTRARDHLLVSGVAPGSEFLDDLNKQ